MENEKEIVQKRIERMQRKVREETGDSRVVGWFFLVVGVFSRWPSQSTVVSVKYVRMRKCFFQSESSKEIQLGRYFFPRNG